MTAAATATKPAEAKAPEPARPLPADRIKAIGDTTGNDVCVHLLKGQTLDYFFDNYSVLLKDGGLVIRASGRMRVKTYGDTWLADAEIVMADAARQHLELVEVIELRRWVLRPEHDLVAQPGWSFAWMGSADGWCVLFNGEIRFRNLTSRAHARRLCNEQMDNAARQRR